MYVDSPNASIGINIILNKNIPIPNNLDLPNEEANLNDQTSATIIFIKGINKNKNNQPSIPAISNSTYL